MAEERRPATREEKLHCIQRELGFRRRVYERKVGDGRMTQRQADKEIWLMEEIERDYLNSPEGRLI